MTRFLIIQTAFIGDVILTTPLLEKIRQRDPQARVDVMVRKGNEGLLANHPGVHRLFVLDKQDGKWRNVFGMIREIRKTRYDHLINLQRFLTTGIISLFAHARRKVGFDKNPLSMFYHRRVKHVIGDGTHEIERNLALLDDLYGAGFVRPGLYPSPGDYEKVRGYQGGDYVCLAPASVWYTKQFPEDKWVELINLLDASTRVYLIGGPDDGPLCDRVKSRAQHTAVQNIAGKLSFLETAALMKGARMNYVNDSAPLHIASAMNAPVRAVFCSTVPEFGFYPVSDDSQVVEIPYKLYCRPCGLHGFKTCPEGHFRCAREIDVQQLLS